MRPLACVVLAAGRGTRMGGRGAKVLVLLAGRPLLEHVLAAAAPLGPDRTVVVVGHGREAVTAAFAGRGLEFCVQAEQLGTAHAALQTASLLGDFPGDLLVLSGDMPLVRSATLRALLVRHRRRGADLTLLSARVPDPTGLGRVVRDAAGRVVRIVEERDIREPAVAALREVNLGVYAARPAPFYAALRRVGRENAQGEYYLPDVVPLLGAGVEAWSGAAPEEGLGVNSPAELARAEAWLRRREGTDLRGRDGRDRA